ncbi:MAG: 4-hydroxythreonine-4-phosphate dehydrogenase PdxA [Acidobacteriota bacterium]
MSDSKGNLPVIAITMGDPAGIGPEIVLKCLTEGDIATVCSPLIIGDVELLERTADQVGIDRVNFEEKIVPFTVDLANVPTDVIPGIESSTTGKSSAEYIEKAVELWREGKVDAIATAPISKSALAMAGYPYPGHTEFLASLTDTKEFAMSFFADELRVVLLSTHVSLRNAIDLVKTESLVKLIDFSAKQLELLLGRSPKLAVAGVNPHASEGGMFGNEEAREIIPAIEACRADGIDVSGPFSPDTIFLRGYRGEFDGVIACYHDQATIAVKSLAFGSSVNVTLGLPLIRTSVDHGTAFDIAGKGIAEFSSVTAAIKLAAKLANDVRERYTVPK